jgi:hypothetical protein
VRVCCGWGYALKRGHGWFKIVVGVSPLLEVAGGGISGIKKAPFQSTLARTIGVGPGN